MKSVGVWFVCDLVKWKGAVQVGNSRCKTQCRGTGNRKRRKGKERDKGGGVVIVHLAGIGKAGRRREDSLHANNLCECQRRDGKQHIHIPLSP